MLDTIKKIVKFHGATFDYPHKPLDKTGLRGAPQLDPAKCSFCGACREACPNEAIVLDKPAGKIGVNLDCCLFCCLCEEACPTGACTMSHEIELAAKSRETLRAEPCVLREAELALRPEEEIAALLKEKIKGIGRSLQIREVDAGSCNACDYEINALNNPLNDLERLGIHFVASPRHADMLLVTGCGSRNMQEALIKAYNAVPEPKLVVAVGACAISGGPFRDTYAGGEGIDSLLPVDVYIPGCPPRPQALIYGILKAIERL